MAGNPLVVTGGAGFIGANFVHWVSERHPRVPLVVIDALTYAGNLANLAGAGDRIRFVRADIAEPAQIRPVLEGAAGVINFAAESHVDRSLESAAPFLHSNITGVQVLLDLVREMGIPRFVQVSTDEVYGSAPEGIRFDEQGALRPSSPYAASKAAADLLVHAAVTSWGTDAVITRCCNNYGPWQFPEKLIPLMITNLMEGLPLPIYGDGLQVREWIHVRDHCAALWAVWERGRAGRLYNIGTGQEVSNLELVKTLVRLAGAAQESITFVGDRPGHDRRYALDSSRLRQELAWQPEIPLKTGLEETMTWYRENRAWWEQVRSGAYLDWYDRKYGGTDQGPGSDQPSS